MQLQPRCTPGACSAGRTDIENLLEAPPCWPCSALPCSRLHHPAQAWAAPAAAAAAAAGAAAGTAALRGCLQRQKLRLWLQEGVRQLVPERWALLGDWWVEGAWSEGAARQMSGAAWHLCT